MNTGEKGDCVEPWENGVTVASFVYCGNSKNPGICGGQTVTAYDLKEQPFLLFK